MFHILNDGQDFLQEDSKVLCGVPIRREAISMKRFNKYANEGKLNQERCCKKCLKLSSGKVSRARRNETRPPKYTKESLLTPDSLEIPATE